MLKRSLRAVRLTLLGNSFVIAQVTGFINYILIPFILRMLSWSYEKCFIEPPSDLQEYFCEQKKHAFFQNKSQDERKGKE